MSSIETAILCAALLGLSLFLGDTLQEKQTEVYASYPFFQGH